MSITIAEQLEENEQYDKAYEEYKRLYSQKPDSVHILERLGHLAIILNKKQDAEEYYNKIIEFDATNTVAYEQLMDIYIHTDKYKYYISRGNLHVLEEQLSHAINDFKKALNHAQKEEEVNSTRFVLATLYEQTGKNHKAIDEYLRILDTSTLNEIVFLKLAQIYIKENSIESAIETLERAQENGFDSEIVKENLARLYLRNHQPEKAREFTADDLVKVRSLLDEEKNREAFEILEKTKEQYKKEAEYYSLLAQYYFNQKDWNKSLETVIEYDKYAKNSPLSYQMRALIYEEKRNDLEAHINWAKYNLARGNKDVALNEYLQAYQLKDDNIILVKNIAELLDDLGDNLQANEFWEKVIKLDPKNRKGLEKVADFRGNIGDYRSQTDVLEQLYELDNRNAAVVKKLAQAYEKIKNKPKAVEYYNKFIEIAPVNEESEKIKQKLNKLEHTQMEEDEGLLGKIMKLFSKN